MRAAWLTIATMVLGITTAWAQTRTLLRNEYFQAIRDESSGELPLVDFRAIESRFSGFSPSRGGDLTADYLATRMKECGLTDVRVEGFPADGKRYFWTYLTEPSWEAESGMLEITAPRHERLADFAINRVVLGRFSTPADVTADLVDVGRGDAASDYAGREVRGKIVLATGDPGGVHAEAVWRHGAAGVLWHRTTDAVEYPDLVSNPSIVPWLGPNGEAPGFAFAVSFRTARELHTMLARGERVTLHAIVKSQTGSGEYKQVSASIVGTDRTLPEVWVYAHDNYRNTGGANNLTGVGATIEIARVLQTLISRGTLPPPRRTIRFWWGAEHHASIYGFYAHPERRGRALAMLNVDMTGFEQQRAGAVFRLYRLPYSMPHFLSDVAEDFVEKVGHANSMSVRNADVISTRPGPGFYDATFAPTGSRSELHYMVEAFTGPSDHEDVVDASIGVPAVLYNDWPDPFIGTQDDDASRVDPTQMRRAVMTIAGTAYYVATLSAAEVPALASTVTAYAQSRLAKIASDAFATLESASDVAAAYQEGTIALNEAIRRETAALNSLGAIGDSVAAAAAIERGRRELQTQYSAALDAYKEHGAEAASARHVSLTPLPLAAPIRSLASLVPKRVDTIRGPVNFFRPEFGLNWLRQKTGDDGFRSKIALTSRGHYVLYEALNFADGKRTLEEIRNATSAEYGPIDLAQLAEYFQFLERVGIVSIAGRASDARPDGR